MSITTPTSQRPRPGLLARVLTTRPPWWGMAHVVFTLGLAVAAGCFEALEPRPRPDATLIARCAPLGENVLGAWGAASADGKPPFVELSLTVRSVGGPGWREYTLAECSENINMTGGSGLLLGPAAVQRVGGVEIRTQGPRDDVFDAIGMPQLGDAGGLEAWWADRLEAGDPAAARSPLVEDRGLIALLREESAAQRARVVQDSTALCGGAVRTAWRAGLGLGVLIMAGAGVLAVARAERRAAARAALAIADAGRCAACGYAREGLDPDAPCPECGADPAAIRAGARAALGPTPPKAPAP